MSEQPKLPEHFIDAFKRRSIDAFVKCGRTNRDPDIQTCVDLHNSGTLNLLSIVEWPEFETLKINAFFGLQHFFNKAIPSLAASPTEMMSAIEVLIRKAGSDLAATLPNGAFRDWCRSDLSRAHEVIQKAKIDEGSAKHYLVFALEAANDLKEARAIVADFKDERRIAGLRAIARIPHGDESERDASIAALASVPLDNSDESLRAGVSEAILPLMAKFPLKPEDAAFSTLRAALSANHDISHHIAARALYTQGATLGPNTISIILDSMLDVKAEHKSTIDLLDLGLGRLLLDGCIDPAIDFVTSLVRRSGDKISLAHFDNLADALFKGPASIFDRTVLRWLLSGDSSLCLGLSKVFQKRDLQANPLKVGFDVLELSDVQKQFICRKAIGYFFSQPIIAGSIVVSCIRTASSNLTDVLTGLLFDPLLASYAGALRDYLASLEETDPAKKAVQSALAHADSYVAGLGSAGPIRELHPSEHQRQLERLRMHDEINRAFKAARKSSVLLSFVKQSTLLYGNRSLNFVVGPDQKRRPIEMELRSLGGTFEWPRMETLDPVGLEMKLRIFRAEQFKT